MNEVTVNKEWRRMDYFILDSSFFILAGGAHA